MPSVTVGPRITVVGAGLIGRAHVARVRRFATLCAVVDPDPAAGTLAREAGARWYRDLDEALADEAPDGAIVATPNGLHVPQGLALVERGVPILVEKPIADRSEDGARLVAAAERAGVPVLVGHHRRHNPLIAAAKDAIDSGRLGRIVAVDARVWLYKPAAYFEVGWRRRPGAGPIFINLIHDVDLLRHLCGEIVRVRAVQSSAVRGFEVEDTAAMILEFASGALGTATISDTAASPFSWELTAGENPAYPKTGAHAIAIAGTRGSLSVPDLTLWFHPGPPSWWEPIEEHRLDYVPADPLDRQMRHFLDVVAGRARPLVDGREGLASLKVVEAVKAAAARDAPVALTDETASPARRC